ncbi:MAG TPA: hypothetical protein VF622_12255, partial [Segetibacter sp.]
MRNFLFFILFLHTGFFAYSQPPIDSALQVLKTSKEDTNKVKTLNWLAYKFQWNDPKKSLEYGLPALALAQKLKYKKGEIRSLFSIGEALAVSGNYAKAIEIKFKALEEAENLKDEYEIGIAFGNIAAGYFYQGDYEQTIRYTKKAVQSPEVARVRSLQMNGFLAEAYFKLNRLDSALYYAQRAYEIDVAAKDKHWSVPYFVLAGIHQAQKHYDLALQFYQLGLAINP